MLILALDSCGAGCAAGVWQDGHVIVQKTEAMERGQDARLMPMVVDVLKQAHRRFSDLDLIAVTRGPGSFTGVRVGLAAARGLGLAAGKPVIGVDRFTLYHALHEGPGKNILVVINSKRTELFCRYFPASGVAPEACLMSEAEIKIFLSSHPDTMVVGDNFSSHEDIIGACALCASKADRENSDFEAKPLYLRAPDVTLPTAKSR